MDLKTKKINMRIPVNILDAFDSIVGQGNRSHRLREYMEEEIINSNKYVKIKHGYGKTEYKFYPKGNGSNRD